MSKIITGHGDFYGYLSEAQVVFQLGGRKQHKHSPSWLLNHIKAAKYYQLVAQLVSFASFGSMFRVFHLA